MKIKVSSLIVSLLASFSIMSSLMAHSQSTPKVRRTFYCGVNSSFPATMVKTPGFRDRVVVRWKDEDWDSHLRITPQDRCRIVSKKFQEFYDKGLFKYIMGGIVDGQEVVCVARLKKGPCAGILWALRPTDEANEIVKQLFGVLARQRDPLNQSGGVYVDLDEILSSP